MRICKKILPMLIIIGILVSSGSAWAVSISAKGGFVMNANTGEEVYSHNGDTAFVPASMTKVMAAYVIYDAIGRGQVSKDTEITIGSVLAEYSRNPGYSNVVLKANSGYTLDELLGAIFVVSANAAVMAVGDYLYGSEAAFVNRMNQFVSDWGIDARFADCSGVSSKNKVSPRAMAYIANRLITDYPDCLNYTGLTSINFRGQRYYATNKMLPGRAYDYYGTMGLKTGTTSAAGACFTSVVERDGIKLISVIMGAPYSNARYTDSIAMLDYAFGISGAAAPKPQEKKQAEPNAKAATVYVNDMPVPGFYVEDDSSAILVRVEDLCENGFDITYEDDSNTLIAVNNKEKQIVGHSDFSVDGLVITPAKPVNVILKHDSKDLGVYTAGAYDINGQTAINVQELTYLGWVVQRGKMATIVTR